MEDKVADSVVLGVDIGGTKIRLGLVAPDGKIALQKSWPVVSAPLKLFTDRLATLIDAFLKEIDPSVKIVGIGIGTKGLVDYQSQRIRSGSLFQQCNAFDLCAALAQRYNLPTVIDNDLNATAAAEARWGIGKDLRYFTYVNIGTGTAVGIVDDGRLVRGVCNAAGEIGEYLFGANAERPFYHVLESVVSGKGLDTELGRIAKDQPKCTLYPILREGRRVLSFELFQAARDGDPWAMQVVESATEMMAQLLINLEWTLNSRVYVFGGGVVADKGWFLERIRLRTEALCRERNISWQITLKVSELGSDDAGLLGAASVLYDRYPA